MTMTAPCDALVVGGGPGGSTTAGFLARAGRRVILLEREFFPRFHIGESLLPYNRRIFEELGVLGELETAGFPRKLGAQFELGNGTMGTLFVFSAGALTREAEALQVERAKFDEILMRHAARMGADVREGWTVSKFRRTSAGLMEVEAADPSGGRHVLQGRWLIDASGRGNVTGNQEGLRRPHPRLRKMAVFSHFAGVRLDPGERGGDTIIVRLSNQWFWIIPLGEDRVSVGLVLDRSELTSAERSPADLFHERVASSPVMRGRMEGARPLIPLQVTSDFSYYNQRLTGPGLLRVGDAAGFMDPIFSAGVYLAMTSGRWAALTVDHCLGNPGGTDRRVAEYERRVWRGMRFYWELVELFYTREFMEVFLQPRHRWDLPAAVNAVLAGELEGGWAMRWRMRLFFWIIRLQRRWPLVPRLEVS